MRIARLLERIGRSLGFSPEGRAVRVWVRGAPGGDETEVVGGTVVALVPPGSSPSGAPAAVVELRRPLPTAAGELRWLLAVPSDRGWGLHALWFSFIAIEARPLSAPSAAPGESLGRWFMRLGRA